MAMERCTAERSQSHLEADEAARPCVEIKDPTKQLAHPPSSQPALIQGQATLRPAEEQLVPNSESYFNASEFSHLIDFIFDLPSRSTMLTLHLWLQFGPTETAG